METSTRAVDVSVEDVGWNRQQLHGRVDEDPKDELPYDSRADCKWKHQDVVATREPHHHARWTAHRTVEDGSMYFHNQTTGASTWELPPDAAKVVDFSYFDGSSDADEAT